MVASVFCVIAVVMLSGCLGTKTLPVSRPLPPSIFVEYHRTGGSDGFDDRLVIFDNGVAVISGSTANREIKLNQTDLDKITGLFDQAQFPMLLGNYTARRGRADYIKYSISYHSKSVNAEDSAVPPSLQPVIDEMNRIVGMGFEQEQVAGPFSNFYT